MSILDADYFNNEEAAYAYLEARVWRDGRRCPHCGVIGKSSRLEGKSTRIGTYKCYACRKPFTLKIGTIFEGSHVPLHVWLRAIFLLTSTQKSFTATELHEILGISIKSAIFVRDRIQRGLGKGFLPQIEQPDSELSGKEFDVPLSLFETAQGDNRTPEVIPGRDGKDDFPLAAAVHEARPPIAAGTRRRSLAALGIAVGLCSVAALAAVMLPRLKPFLDVNWFAEKTANEAAPHTAGTAAPGERPVTIIDGTGGGAGERPTTTIDATGGGAGETPTTTIDATGGRAGEKPTTTIDATGGGAGERRATSTSTTGGSASEKPATVTGATGNAAPDNRQLSQLTPPPPTQIISPRPPPPPVPPIEVPIPTPRIEIPKIAQPPSSAPGTEQAQITLKGIRVVDSADKVQAAGFESEGITVTGIARLDAPVLRDSLSALLGQPISPDLLQAASKVIADWYRGHDHPFVDIAFPAGQDITNGVVQMVVTEARTGKIVARNNTWFSSNLLASEVRLKPGDPISLSELEADRDWLNLNPFRTVDIVAEKGAEPGTTDISVNTLKEEFPLRGHVAYDDTGPAVLGLDRWSVGIDWGNALWQDDIFSYQYSSSLPLWRSLGAARANYDAHSASYVARLPWHDQFAVMGAYASAMPEVGPDIGLTGINWQVSARYITSLPAIGAITEQAQLGFDFKSSNSNLLFGGFQISNTTSEVAQFTLDYSAALSDSLGQTSLDNTLVFSPGGLTGHNNDTDFQAQQAFARARYLYDHLALTRLTGLPQDAGWVQSLGWFKDMSSVTRVMGQIAGNELLPSEQFGIGGVDTIPGYSQRTANGSLGYLVSEEIYSPAFSLARLLAGADIMDQAQVGLFLDQGGVRDKHPEASTSALNDLSSVGADFHYVWGRYVNLHVGYGLQLRQAPGTNNGGRTDVVLNLGY